MEFKNFARGMGSVIELFPADNREENLNFYCRSDEEALKRDWQIVGDDIKTAMGNQIIDEQE